MLNRNLLLNPDVMQKWMDKSTALHATFFQIQVWPQIWRSYRYNSLAGLQLLSQVNGFNNVVTEHTFFLLLLASTLGSRGRSSETLQMGDTVAMQQCHVATYQQEFEPMSVCQTIVRPVRSTGRRVVRHGATLSQQNQLKQSRKRDVPCLYSMRNLNSFWRSKLWINDFATVHKAITTSLEPTT